MVKTLFYTGARVSELVHIRVADLHLTLDPPQICLAHAQGGLLCRYSGLRYVEANLGLVLLWLLAASVHHRESRRWCL